MGGAMEMVISDERRMLRDSLRGSLARMAGQPGLWPALADLGIGAALLREEDGGMGGTGADIALIAEETGRAAAQTPMIDSILLGAATLAAAGGHDDLVERLIAGDTTAALADLEPGQRYSPARGCVARSEGGQTRLSGAKTLVVGGDTAEWFLVTASDDANGTGVYLLAGDAPGLTRRGYPLMEGGAGADLELASCPAHYLGPRALLDRPIASAVLAICADAVGVIERVLEMTADYLRTRQQFGQPIGRFQVLGHRMADLLIELEQARSASANLAEALDRADRDLMLAAAKVTLGQTARLVAEEAIQMHGGIGLTQEYGLGDLVRRLLAADARFGDADHHLEEFARMTRQDAPICRT